MAENTSIEWAHHTFNPWIGCTKISPGCDNCYAEARDKRFKKNRWGVSADRTKTKTWRDPVRWQNMAHAEGVRYRVFCASLADIFDNHRSIKNEWRNELWELIRNCPDLDFLLLTKRPQNIRKYLPDDWGQGYRNVWLGATVENQSQADRLNHLIWVPAALHFVSMEPLLEDVDIREHLHFIDWVITGGESGNKFRPVNANWFRSIRDQCESAGVPFLFKQWAGKNQKIIKALGRKLDGVEHNGYAVRNREHLVNKK